MPAYVAVWNWFANNPVAQWIAGIGLGLAIFFFWLARHDAKVRELTEIKAERKARKQKDKIIEDMKENADDRLEKAERARASVPDDATTDSMSDEEYELIFGRKRNR